MSADDSGFPAPSPGGYGYGPPGYPPPHRRPGWTWAVVAVSVIVMVLTGGYVASQQGLIHVPGISPEPRSAEASSADTDSAWPTGGTTSDQQFQQALTRYGINLPLEEARGYAQSFCAEARQGNVLDAAIATMFRLISYNYDQVDAFTALAATTYCPDITKIPAMRK